MTWWEALILGILQGLTEFFPISSSGHLVLGSHVLGLQLPGIVFEVAVHVATLVSVLVVYRQRVQGLLLGLFKLPGGDDDARFYALKLILATLPAAFVGFFLKDWFEARFQDPAFAATMLLVTGCLIWSIRWAREKRSVSLLEVLPIAAAAAVSFLAGMGLWFIIMLGSIAAIVAIARMTALRKWHSRPTPTSALLMGVGQAVAILPGISRSGTTLLTGTWHKVTPLAAAEFSFMMSIVVIMAAAVLKVPDAMEIGGQIGFGQLLIGCLSATISGVLAIRFFLLLLRRQSFHLFAYYCWFTACLFLLFSR